MTDQPHRNRFPLLFALVGAVILLAVGGYIFWRGGDGRASTGQAAAEVASEDADKKLAAAGMNSADRAATEAVVRAYILAHPEIVSEAIDLLRQRETVERLRAAGSRLTAPFAGAEAGNPDGDVTVVEFNDYNCGFCRSSVADVERLVANDPNVRVVYREAAILSPTSRDAALWALAAAKQGKHKAFHKAMFAGERPNDRSIRTAAARAGLDIAAAEKFAASAAAAAEVDSNLAIMQATGFAATPTFVIGDRVIEGALGYEALKTAVAEARKQG